MTTLRRTLVTLVLVLLASVASAQAPSPVFVSIDDHPFGPGDRDATAKIKLQPGDTSGNIEIWVVYGDSRDAVLNGQIGGPLPQGRARIGSVDSAGVATATFVFPHTDHKTPNLADRNAQAFRSGKQVYYKWIKRRGDIQTASAVVDFRLPDKLTVVLFGDSYASGEGAPYAEGPRKWDDEQCHRSSNSGQARAVKAYKAAHAEVAVAFRNVSCSGAGVADGITRSQSKKGFFQNEDFPSRVKPQYEQVKEWLAANHYEQLNVAIVSIGGNDIGFGPLVETFFVGPGNITDANDANARHARENTAINLNENIPAAYDELKRFFDSTFDYDRILVTAYPDPTRDKDGQFCGKPLTMYGLCWGPVEALNGQGEFDWAYTNLLVKMNSKIREKVQGFPGWVFVDGTVARAQRNGICNCDVPYFNTIGAAMLVQGDPAGTMHPNRLGHTKIYQPAVLDALEREIGKIRHEYAKERAIEIAKEKARRKTQAAAAPVATLTAVRRPVGERHVVTPETLQKERETAARMRQTEDVRDERQDDDYER